MSTLPALLTAMVRFSFAFLAAAGSVGASAAEPAAGSFSAPSAAGSAVQPSGMTPGPSRDAALESLLQADAGLRLSGVRRLAEIGTVDDVEPLLKRLRDADPEVRLTAADALWRIWGRSGDAEIDALYLRGSEEMRGGELRAALATFEQIVNRKPDFAEGWNKRATIRFLLGDLENSLRDCDEVFKRNPYHFGALAGAGQIHVLLGHPELALGFFRRALAVNPNLEGPAAMAEMLERHLREEAVQRRRHST